MSGFIFGRPINEATQKALERKQALVGTRIASREGFAGLAREFFNIRTPWVKLSSAVAITDDAKLDYFGESFDLALAELNVLYSLDTYENNTLAETRNLSEYYGGNLNLRKEHTAGTVSYEDYGPRPKPGITGVTVTSHGMYGALRTVTVNFKCWTPYQLDVMDNLYMRPGYTMLLEFGHSHYLAGEDYDYTIEDEMLLIDLYKGGYLSKEVNDFDKVYADIQSKKIQYGGAYEGFLGVVKNFSWSFTLDGGYDCSIDLVSKGEIIESITANAGASVTASGNLTESTKLGRILQGLSRINNLIPGQNNWYELPNREYNLDKADQNSTDQNFLTYYKQSFNTGDKDVDQPQPQTYITLQTLNSYLNADLLKDGTNGDTSYIKLDTAFEESKYYTNNLQISIDPLVCLLPKGASTKAIFPNFFYETRKNQPQSEVEIKDILLNVNFLKKAIRSSLTDDGQIEVKAFYDRVFKGIEESTGGINKFELHCDENNTFYIIDRKYIEVTGDRPQPLYLSGLSSIVKNISLTSKLSPNLSTLIAISAQDKSSDLGLDATSFRKLNSGLEDRVTGEKVSGGVSLNTSTYRFTEDDEAGIINIEKTDFFETLQASIAKLYNGTDSVKTNKRGLQSLYSGFLNTALEKSTAAHASFAIPFELTLTLDGTGGFTVGETFEINGDILPLTYKETIFNGMGFTITQNSRVGFIITSLEQNISSAGWNTLIKSQIYLNSESDVKPRTYKTDPLNNSSDEDFDNNSFEDFVNNTPWSAAFIVYCVTKRGVNFPRSAAHTGYAQAIRNGGYPFTALDPATTKLKRGDIVIKNRSSNTLKFSSKTWSGYSHGDIVNTVTATQAQIIGGNVSDTVIAGNVALSDSKLINVNKGIPGSYFVILRPNNSTDATKIANEAVKQFKLINKRKETDKSIAVNLDEYYRSANLNPPSIA